MEKKPITCKKCGCPDLKWAQSNAGKWYLTPMEGAHIKNEKGWVMKTIKIAHRCDLYEAQKAEDAHMEAVIIEDQASAIIDRWMDEEATDEQRYEYLTAIRAGLKEEFRTTLLKTLAQRTEVR